MITKTIKEYTVNLKNADEEGKTFFEFTSLSLARSKAIEENRKGNFYSLLNYKGIPLAL